MLGMLCNRCNFDSDVARFIPMSALPRTDFPGRRVLDARHGRVLCEEGSILMVWDPIADEVQELLFPQKESRPWSAAVLCAAAGACGHLDCHRGPFLVVFVCRNKYGNTVIYTYSSDAAPWSAPVFWAQHSCPVKFLMGSVLVGNALYFGNMVQSIALKYDLELCQVSVIQLPPSLSGRSMMESLLTTTEDGRLGLIDRDDYKLYMLSRKDTHEVDAKWERRVIELKAVFPIDVDVTKLVMLGSSGGIIFMGMGDEVYTIDLMTCKVMTKVYEEAIYSILPYMSFYTPVLQVATTGEGPSVGASTAEQT